MPKCNESTAILSGSLQPSNSVATFYSGGGKTPRQQRPGPVAEYQGRSSQRGKRDTSTGPPGTAGAGAAVGGVTSGNSRKRGGGRGGGENITKGN